METAMTTIDLNEAESVNSNSSVKRAAALKVVRRLSYWSAGVGLIPIPALDLTAIVAIQAKMIGDIAKVYNVPFNVIRAKAIVSALIGGTLPVGAGIGISGLLGSSSKAVPGIGTIIGTLTVPAAALATTKTLGKLFIEHFETGGTLLNFDADKMREYFKNEVSASPATV